MINFKDGMTVTNHRGEAYEVVNGGEGLRRTKPTPDTHVYTVDTILNIEPSGPWYLETPGGSYYIPSTTEYNIIELLRDKDGNFAPTLVSSAAIVDALDGVFESYVEILARCKPETITLTQEQFDMIVKYNYARSTPEADEIINGYKRYFNG